MRKELQSKRKKIEIKQDIQSYLTKITTIQPSNKSKIITI